VTVCESGFDYVAPPSWQSRDLPALGPRTKRPRVSCRDRGASFWTATINAAIKWVAASSRWG